MILVDSVYINDGGGLILLKYLVEILEESDLDVYYLFDIRALSFFEDIHATKRMFISNSFYKRISFYRKNKIKYTSVLCFGNIPPPLKLSIPVHVYFHQQLFLEIPKNFSTTKKIIYTLKQNILKFYKHNATSWIVQSQLMRSKFSKKYLKNIETKVKILPFYPPLQLQFNNNLDRKKGSFLYVSNSPPHKNHKILIEAFCNSFDRLGRGSLLVTVPDSSVELCKLISKKSELGYPIVNVGFVDRKKLTELYFSHEYLIFPSLAESFGLGLVEAIDAGCKVIVSDLPYAYEVCKPSLTFDPHSTKSLRDAISTAIETNLPYSEKLISNNIEHLISLLTDKS